MLLVKTDLPDGFIDAAIGEPDIIGQHFMKIVAPKVSNVGFLSMLERPELRQYPYPAGHKDLVSILSERFKAPVVVCNGAKQALAASFYAVHRADQLKLIRFRSPYWALLPPLVESMDLDWVDSLEGSRRSATLLVAPNNPDGWCSENFQKKSEGPLIHDGAYNTEAYLPKEKVLGPTGDLQVFSFSKMLGLPGLRLGCVVCHNEKYYDHLLQYMEASTVGVSNVSQEFLAQMFRNLNPNVFEEFNSQCRQSLTNAKNLLTQISPQILDVPKPESYHGMFAWCRVINAEALQQSRVKFASGKPFGQEGFVRINLALDFNLLEEVVNRLNFYDKIKY